MITLEQLSRLSIGALTAAYRKRAIDPVEVMVLTLEQAARVNPRINALYELQDEPALAAAQASRARYQARAPMGAMDGVPVTVKDSVQAVGFHWHHGSVAHGPGVLGTADSPPVERLKANGAIVFAKCTMPDFGLSASGVSSLHGVTRNPWGLSWNTGGSSAGAGASLAAGIGMMSVGSDIAGSVRLPASHCGLASLKPTQGMVAHTPASDIRSAGPMARSANDLELLLRVLGGVHKADRFSVPVTDDAASISLGTVKVAAYADFGFGPIVEPAVQFVFDKACMAMSHIVGEVVRPAFRYDSDALLPIDASLKLRAWREYSAVPAERRERTPEALVDWFSEAGHWSTDHIVSIDRGLAAGVAQTSALFADADFLITPVMPMVNFPANDLGIDPGMPVRHCTFTAPFNQSGHPAVAICAGHDARGLPVGVQLVGQRFSDLQLLRLAVALEAVLWPGGRPENYWPLQPRAE